jgi:threonine aldolase
MKELIDLRSDTVTKPTQEMREAMYAAEVGDDVYGDDPTVNRLEEYAAEKVGKEAALFVPSGTFGNQLALFTHCRRGTEVLLGEECHIVQHEVGAASVIAGVQLRTLPGYIEQADSSAIESRIREEDIHEPSTGLICIENALSNGRVVPLANMRGIYEAARKHGIPVHMDGARLFNAAAFLNADVRELTQYCDSVMFCLSKGLCAPVGSMLAGGRDFIARARKGRKLMGGGMRQAGFLAAAGLVALEKMTLRLGEDHENALLLARKLSGIPGIRVNPEDIHINMVFFEMDYPEPEMKGFAEKMRSRGILIHSGYNRFMRFVTHYPLTGEDMRYVAASMRDILKETAGNG